MLAMAFQKVENVGEFDHDFRVFALANAANLMSLHVSVVMVQPGNQ